MCSAVALMGRVRHAHGKRLCLGRAAQGWLTVGPIFVVQCGSNSADARSIGFWRRAVSG